MSSTNHNLGFLDTIAAYAVGLILGISICYAVFIPIVYLMIWAANTAFGTHLPLTFWSAFGGATLIMCFNFLFRKASKKS